MPYQPIGWVEEKTTLGPVNLNHMETQYAEARADLKAEVEKLLAMEAEQNVAIWELQGNVLSAREGFSGWHGEPFLLVGNEVESVTKPGLAVTRSTRVRSGFVEGFTGLGMSDQTIVVGKETLDIQLSPTTNVFYGGVFAKDVASDTEYLAINADRVLKVFKRVGSSDQFTPLPDSIFSTTPIQLGSGPRYIAWSPDSKYLAICNRGLKAANLQVFKRTGDTFTALATPPNPVDDFGCVSWDPTGTYLVCGTSTSTAAYFVWWKKLDNDTFYKLNYPSITPTVMIWQAVWDPTGTYLMMGADGAPWLFMYKRTGDTLTKVYIPDQLPAGDTRVAYSPDGRLLAVASGASASTYISLYAVNGETFTKIADHGMVAPAGAVSCRDVCWTSDGKYLIAGFSTSAVTGVSGFGYSMWKKADGANTFTRMPNPELAPTPEKLGVSSISITSDNTYVLAGLMLSSGTGQDPWMLVKGQSSDPNMQLASLTTKTRQLSEVCDAVYIIDDADLSQGPDMSRDYDVSLDGGTTWHNVAAIGDLVRLNHTGTSLKVRLNIRKSITGDITQKLRVRWFAVFATKWG